MGFSKNLKERLANSGSSQILIEVKQDESVRSDKSVSSGVLGYGIGSRKEIYVPAQSAFSLSNIKDLANVIERQLRETNVVEAEVTFGVQVSEDAKIVVSQGLEKSNFVFKLKFQNQDQDLDQDRIPEFDQQVLVLFV